jgi:vacuolar-type H+-ATPase subunit F/Vma7
MTGGRILALGSADTVLGLGLVGIDGTVVTDATSAAAALAAAIGAPGVVLVLVGQTFAAALGPQLEAVAHDVSGPLVVEVPDGPGDDVALDARVRRLLGVSLEAR